MREKRRHVRVGTRIAVVYSPVEGGDDGRTARRGIIDSLSVGGALMTAEERLPDGSIITVRVPVSSMADSVTVDGVVLRAEHAEHPDQYLHAVEFYEVPFENARRISSLVDQQLSQVLATFDTLVDHLDLLREFSRSAVAATDLQAVLDALVDTAMRATDAQAGSVMLIDSTGEWLNFVVARGPKADDLEKFRLRVGDGIAGLVARYGRPLNVPDPHQDARWRGDIASAINFETRGLLGVPFMLGGRVAGVVQVLNKRGAGRFSSEDMRLLDALSTQAGVVVQNLRLWSALQGGTPEFPHFPLAPVPEADLKAGNLFTDAVRHATANAFAVCVSASSAVVFNDSAADMLELADPSGHTGDEIEKRLKTMASFGSGIPQDSPLCETPIPAGGTVHLDAHPLRSRDGEDSGLVVYLTLREPENDGEA